MKQINHGLNWELEKQQQSENDWVFGTVSPVCLAENIPATERDRYLPKGELQNIGEEKMDCSTRAAINILETKFNWLLKNGKLSDENIKWLYENGYIILEENGKI